MSREGVRVEKEKVKKECEQVKCLSATHLFP